MAINDHNFPPLPSQKHTLPTRSNNATLSANTTRVSTRSSTSAATFNDLPDELVLEILKYLAPIDFRKFHLRTLTSLSRTSRRLHRIVTPKVYEKYHTSFCEPYPFLRTIISDPLLAELVQHANIIYGPWVRRNEVKYSPTAQDKKVIKEGIRALGLTDWKRWVAECNADDADLEALSAMMLILTPNIVSLNTHDTDYEGHKILKWIEVIRKASLGIHQGRVHAFKHLRSIEVNMAYSSLLQVGPLFRLASLRRFVALELFENNTQNGRAMTALQRIMPPGSNNIEELHFKKESFVSSEKLAVVLASPRRLKTFTYDLSAIHLMDEDDVGQELGSMNLSATLDCQKESLESLHFTTSLLQVTLPGVLRFHGLGAFQSLQHLHCPYVSVFRTDLDISTAFLDMLPSSLKTLHLQIPRFSAGDVRGRCVEHLTKNYTAIAPALRELRVSPWSYYDWQQCESLCSASGLAFQADKMPYNDGVLKQEASGTHYASSSHSSDEVDLYSNDEEEQQSE